jgi:putative endonuclease
VHQDFQPAVYIMASQRNGTLYVGVIPDLLVRVWQHRTSALAGFKSRYGCKLLVWFEMHATMEHAVCREKQLKNGSRAEKIVLIETHNPRWDDLYPTLVG